MRAVVIEDSRTQALMLAEHLRADGYHVEIAHDGESGVAACIRSAPDLVISDVVMPGIDGFEVCRRLRAHPATAHVPILVLTSLGEPMEVLRALSAGATNFATKPYRGDHLLARVRRMIRGETISELQAEGLNIDATSGTVMHVLFSALEDARARNEELEASRLELERAHVAREEMIGIVAHELRTPLTTLLLRAQVARRKNTGTWPAEVVDVMDLIGRSTGRMVRIIDDLLQATQLEAGTFAIAAEPTDLVAAVNEAVARARSANPEFTIAVEGPERLITSCDPGRVDQVISNLVGNAIKYSGTARDIAVTLEVDKRFAVIAVRDHGIGIPLEQLPLVFDRFFRTQEGKRAAQGVGLGLYLCRKLVELHGGTIKAESTPGQGSVLSFTLPMT